MEKLSRPYRFKPIEGLLRLKKEDYKRLNLLSLLEKVEEDISSSPKGRAKRLTLFFYIIDILNSNNIPFYVRGGIILQYHLHEHSRETKDIDILIKMDPDDFYFLSKKAFKNNDYGLDLKITKFSKNEPSENYYYLTFNMRISASFLGKEVDIISLEGISSDLFDEIKPIEYKGPSIIKDNFLFLGVPIEYSFADKILAITSELKRPYKHLVDAYSISQIDVDIKKVKRYLNIALSYENIIRKKLGIDCSTYKYQIKDNKQFSHGYYFPMIQAGYKIGAFEMIEALNKYMSLHFYK